MDEKNIPKSERKNNNWLILGIGAVTLALLLSNNYINGLEAQNTYKNNMKVCDSFCQCDNGNITVVTYFATQKTKDFIECTCAVYNQPRTFILPADYACNETVGV
jgi:hypothetical protein